MEREPAPSTEKGGTRRVLMRVGFGVGLVVAVVQLGVDKGEMQHVGSIGLTIAALTLLSAAAALRATRAASRRVGELAFPVVLVSIILMDWVCAAQIHSFRSWAYAVVMMDAGLVADVSPTLQAAAVAAVLVWLGVEAVESAALFGLYGAAYPFATPAPAPPVCDCAHPPCASSSADAMLGWIGAAMVFIADFGMTRGFAHGMQREQAMMVTAVEVAEDVSSLLASYETEKATALIEGTAGDTLPTRLRETLLLLVQSRGWTFPGFPGWPGKCLFYEVLPGSFTVLSGFPEVPNPRFSWFSMITHAFL
jgi:hypothetical protein